MFEREVQMDYLTDERRRNLTAEFYKYARYWEGDILRDDDGAEWEVTDVAYSFSEKEFRYAIEKQAGTGRSRNRRQSWLASWEVVSKGDAPLSAIERFEPGEDFVDDPERAGERLDELSNADPE